MPGHAPRVHGYQVSRWSINPATKIAPNDCRARRASRVYAATQRESIMSEFGKWQDGTKGRRMGQRREEMHRLSSPSVDKFLRSTGRALLEDVEPVTVAINFWVKRAKGERNCASKGLAIKRRNNWMGTWFMSSRKRARRIEYAFDRFVITERSINGKFNDDGVRC